MNTWLIISIFVVTLTITSANNEGNKVKDEDKMKTFPKKLLARRREEHFSLLKMIANNPKYEHRFQLIYIGLTKSFDLINENKHQLNDKNVENVTKAKVILLENSALFMDFIVNFIEDIYIVLNKISKTDPDKNWKELLKFSLSMLESNIELIDDLTTRELKFVKNNLESILNEEGIPNYEYENSVRNLLKITNQANKEEEESLKVTKKKKKFKKGPSLQGRVDL